ncbi:unnamed protein product [Nyctereutes procyonoides]|uniref:(raccoon dog) hypothetical protein n=1 Tax=Nyctereutes procyonoides TaxID=34880 RepID=A0A811YR81_NYCPR|nr:unnamed protein product [Nyctereutes procyonoides]
MVAQSQPQVGLRLGLMAGPRRLGRLGLGRGLRVGPLSRPVQARTSCRIPLRGGGRDTSCCFREGGLAGAWVEALEHGVEPAGGGGRSHLTCRVWAPGSLHAAATHLALPGFLCLRILLCDVGTSTPTSESVLENRFLARDGPAVEARPARRLLAAAAPPGRPLLRAELTGPRGSTLSQLFPGALGACVARGLHPQPSRVTLSARPSVLLLPGPHPALPEGAWGCRRPWRGTWGPGGRRALPASPPPRSTCASQPHYPPGVWPSTSCWSP